MEKGDISNAQGYFKDVFVSDPKNSESMLMLASSILSIKNHKDARKTFEKVLHEVDSRDLYALCSVGNINLNFARVDPKNVNILLEVTLFIFLVIESDAL